MMDLDRLRRLATELDECAAELNAGGGFLFTADELERTAEALRFVADVAETAKQ